MSSVASSRDPSISPVGSVLGVLVAVSAGHMINDVIQALLPAIYPMLKDSYALTFTQIGLITFVFQMTGSVLQPFVGWYADKNPLPYSLAVGMSLTLAGLAVLASTHSFGGILISSALIGMGSSIFHPEASRMARLASGGRHGFAQSLFQVGGNLGSALGPALAAAIIIPRGQPGTAWFIILAAAGIYLLGWVGRWYSRHLSEIRGTPVAKVSPSPLPRGQVVSSMSILIALLLSKFAYVVSITSFYTFYLIERFGVSVRESQVYLFVFLLATAAGTIIGGPVGDRIGRKRVIWFSILGVAPFTLLLPHVGLALTVALSVPIGLILASAFSAIVVYGQEMMPGRVGLVAGLFFGLAFGVAGIASVALGKLADATTIEHMFFFCSFLPLIGVVTWFLPELRHNGKAR